LLVRLQEGAEWLKNLPQRPAIGSDEVLVDMSKHFGCACQIRVEPKVIIFLDDRNMKEHRINPLNKVDAIKLLSEKLIKEVNEN